MKIHAEVLKTPAKKERSKKVGLISQDKNKNNLAPKDQIDIYRYF